MVIPGGLFMLSLAVGILLRRSAFVRGSSVRGGWPRRQWIVVTDPGQLLILGFGHTQDSGIVVRTSSDHRILECPPLMGFTVGRASRTHHRAEMRRARDRIVSLLQFDV